MNQSSTVSDPPVYRWVRSASRRESHTLLSLCAFQIVMMSHNHSAAIDRPSTSRSSAAQPNSRQANNFDNRVNGGGTSKTQPSAPMTYKVEARRKSRA